MKVLSKSLAAMVAAATLVGGGAFAVAGTAYAADNDAITVTPNPWYANSFDGWGTSLALFAQAPRRPSSLTYVPLPVLVPQRHRQPRRGIGHHHQSRR